MVAAEKRSRRRARSAAVAVFGPRASPGVPDLERTAGQWGLDPGGQTYQRADEAWRQVGTVPGRPQTLLVTDTEIYAAADDGERTGLYVSTDPRQTWRLRYADRGS